MNDGETCPRCAELAEAAAKSAAAAKLTAAAQQLNEDSPKSGGERAQAAPLNKAYLERLLAELPPAQGELAPQELYLKRLSACKRCEALKAGVLCSWCGCYVALRARPAKARCPHPKGSRW